MSTKRGRWDGNEIILTADMNNNSDVLVTNVDDMSDIIGATAIMTGMVVSELGVPAMEVQISKGISKDNTVGTLLSGDAFASITIAAADGSLDRRDVVEIRRLKEDITPASRQVKDPISGNISVVVIDTEEEYKTEVKVLTGTPGSIADSVEPGWIKITEILVSAAVSSILDAKIYNVDAVVEGGTNTNWTEDITSIYRNGSISDVKKDIFTKGVPAHSLTVPYEEFFSFVQDEGMVWASILAANLGNKPSTNQDKWIPAYAPTKPETISATGAFTTLYRHHLITSDTSGGGNTITVGLPKFAGQKITILCDGIGITHVKGTGIYDGASSLGTPVSDTLKLTITGKDDLSGWIPDNEITADYVSGERVLQESNGSIAFITSPSITWAASTTGSVTIGFPVILVDTSYIPSAIPTELVSGQSTTIRDYSSKTTSQLILRAVTIGGGSPTGSAIYDVIIQGGKY